MTDEKHHILKSWPEYFKAIESGEQTFDVRKNDRDYKVGDTVDFCEYDQKNKRSTGPCLPAVITFVFDGSKDGIPIDTSLTCPLNHEYCILGFRLLPEPEGAPA